MSHTNSRRFSPIGKAALRKGHASNQTDSSPLRRQSRRALTSNMAGGFCMTRTFRMALRSSIRMSRFIAAGAHQAALAPLAALAFLAAPALAGGAGPAGFPVTVRSCDRDVTVAAPPERAISHGTNLTEMMLALGLEARMRGYMGRELRPEGAADAPGAAGARLDRLQTGYATLENLLETGADFLFAGWSYGMRVGGDVTPASLGRYAIPVYELSESCIRLGKVVEPTFDYLFRDIRNLGAIFGVSARAGTLIETWKQRLATVERRVAGKPRPRVFIYDSGNKIAGTAGKYAMPQAIINAAGGVNIAGDIPSSWTRMAWETVVERAPEAIVIVDYSETTAAQKMAFLRSNPAFRTVPAIRDQRFLVLSYDSMTPGPRNVDAVEKLAAFLHATSAPGAALLNQAQGLARAMGSPAP